MQLCSKARSFLLIVCDVSLGVVVTVAGPVVVTIVEDVVVDVEITGSSQCSNMLAGWLW